MSVIVWLISSVFPCVYLTSSPPLCALFVPSKSIHHLCVFILLRLAIRYLLPPIHLSPAQSLPAIQIWIAISSTICLACSASADTIQPPGFATPQVFKKTAFKCLTACLSMICILCQKLKKASPHIVH